MTINRNDLVVAAASVNGADGVALVARSCATARTGVGVYTVTVSDTDALECVALVTPRGTTDVRVAVEHTSDTVKTVRTFSGAVGTAADATFDFLLLKIAAGTLN